MDIKPLRYPSWCLCRLLNDIIGTEEEVALRKTYNAMSYYMHNVYMSYKMLHSGSQGEGFLFSTSDIDLMFIDKHCTVLESLHSIHNTGSDDGRKTMLLMQREGCKPGFVILKLLHRTNDPYIREAIVEYLGYPVVSSLLYRDQHRVSKYDQVGHGPCNTHELYYYETDIASCFECRDWPKEANEFIYRLRPHGWPLKSLLDKIILRGCHLVPVGDKYADLSYIQWRLSFSAAEKDLIHSFNHTQFLVYGLMKIFLKQFINKFQSVDGVLCSYFLKTAMFYSIECTPSSFWREDLLICCFWFCLSKLITWVEVGYCPNYFVSHNNMFHGKVFGENQRNLLTVLSYCKSIGWKCIYLCEDLKSLQVPVNHPETYSRGLIMNEKHREGKRDSIVCNALCHKYVSNLQELYRRFARTLTLLRHSRTREEGDISTLLLCDVIKKITEMNACINVGMCNKYIYRKIYRILLMLAENNVCTGSLYLAIFYYMTGQHKKAVHLCNRVISQWKPYVMYRSEVRKEMCCRQMYVRYVCGRGASLADKVKSAYAFNIAMRLETKRLCPAELLRDLEASAPFPVDIPPLPYTVFLLFLCHHKLGNIDNSVTALHDLQVLIHDKQQGCSDYPIVLNMLAVCQNKLGDKYGAIETCLQSRSLKPDRNGSEKMLDILLCDYF